jgi:hypothetical protein
MPGNLFRGLINFMTIKGMKDKYKDDAEKIFRLQPTMMNLASLSASACLLNGSKRQEP